MSSNLLRAVVTVEATRLSGEDQDRAQSIADLFAWCGDGVLTPNQLHAYLRPDPAASRPRAAALLLRASSGRHYLATACHVLTDSASTTAESQTSLEPYRSESDGSTADEGGGEGQPLRGTTELAFDDPLLNAAHGRGLFSAASFPHLDLSLIWLDQTEPALRFALESAGFEFIGLNAVADKPSRDGASVSVVRSASGSPDDARLESAGRVSGLNQDLSFFWSDTTLAQSLRGTPVIEGDTIVGFYAPQQADMTAASFAGGTVTKAGHLKALLAAHEAGD